MKTAGVGVLCFALGVLCALILRDPQPAPTSVDAGFACPPLPECEPCLHLPTPAAVSRPIPAPARRPPTVPMPSSEADPDAHRNRLRDWFELHAPDLLTCVAKGEPRRKLLLQMGIEPDGRIADAELVGGDELPLETRACVRGQVKALRVPKEELRGREVLVVHLTL